MRADIALVFGNSARGALRAVAIGHLIGKTAAPADGAHRTLDRVEAAGDIVGAGLMVEIGRRAGLQSLDKPHQGAVVGLALVERLVHAPPHTRQILLPVVNRLAERHSAHELAVKMAVGADHARHQDAPGQIVPNIGLGQRLVSANADRCNAVAVDEQIAAGQEEPVNVAGNQRSVVIKRFHVVCLLSRDLGSARRSSRPAPALARSRPSSTRTLPPATVQATRTCIGIPANGV